MEKLLMAAREYAKNIPEQLKDQEWLLNTEFQQAFLEPGIILRLKDLPPVDFSLQKELGGIESLGQVNMSAGKQAVLHLLSQEGDSCILLGALLYMYLTLRNTWSKEEDPVLLQLRLAMSLIAKPTSLTVPANSIYNID